MPTTLLEEEQTTTFETADNLLSYGRKLITEAEKVAQEKTFSYHRMGFSRTHLSKNEYSYRQTQRRGKTAFE